MSGNGPSDTEITLDKTSLTLEKNGNDVQNQKGELTAAVTPESAANQGVEWAITTGADVIDISPSGNSCEITPKKPGTASITVTSKADNSKTASCTVTVNGLVLNQKNITLEAGKTYQLTTTMRPDNKTVTWESDTRTEGSVVASVDQSGLVTAVKEGTANITVTTTDHAYRDTCAVTVEAAGTGGAEPCLCGGRERDCGSGGALDQNPCEEAGGEGERAIVETGIHSPQARDRPGGGGRGGGESHAARQSGITGSESTDWVIPVFGTYGRG